MSVKPNQAFGKIIAYSIATRWRVNILVLLHVLNAVCAASAACSNSSGVVSGTLLRSVWVDGSWTSSHLSVLLSTNSPPMKFFVVPPVALVPFQLADRDSAADLAFGPSEVAYDLTATRLERLEMLRLVECIVSVDAKDSRWWEWKKPVCRE